MLCSNLLLQSKTKLCKKSQSQSYILAFGAFLTMDTRRYPNERNDPAVPERWPTPATLDDGDGNLAIQM